MRATEQRLAESYLRFRQRHPPTLEFQPVVAAVRPDQQEVERARVHAHALEQGRRLIGAVLPVGDTVQTMTTMTSKATEDRQDAVTAALANRALYVSGIRRMTKNEITAVAMIRNAGASSSPVRSTSQAAARGVKPPITPRVTL